MIDINNLIKEAMLSKNSIALNAYRNIKTEIQKNQTAKGAKPLTDAIQLQIIAKYNSNLRNAILEFKEAGRDDLVAEYMREQEVVEKLLPAPVEPEDIEYILYNWADELNFMDYSGEDLPKIVIPKNEMGKAIKHLKSRFPTADGKIISEIVKKYIK